MKIRIATKNDAQSITDLNEKFFHEKGRDFLCLITSSTSRMFVAEDEDQIIGFTGVTFYDWNNTIQIIDIFVHPDFRRRKIGETLLKFLIKDVIDSSYRCLIAEAPSLNSVLQLYLKNGFRICGYNDRYYNNEGPEVAMFLSRDL